MSDSDKPPERPRWQDLEGPPEPPAEDPPAGPPATPPAPAGFDPDAPQPPGEAGSEAPPGPPTSPPGVPGEELPSVPPRPPGAGQTPQNPYIKLTRWNPYQKLTPEGKRFVQELIRFPSVTVGIIVVLALFYLWMIASGWELTFLQPSAWGYGLALAFGALEPELVRQGEYWRLFTPALLHGSLLHLFVNSFMLYQLGRLAENVFGRLGLVVLFVFSAISGCLFSAFIGEHMSIGASGAVMGLVGANIAFGAVHRKKIPEFLRGLFGPTLIVYFFIIFFLGMLPGIDFWGHLGGAVGGAVMGLVLPSQIGAGEGQPARGRWVIAPFTVAVVAVVAALAFMLPRAVGYEGESAREAIKDYKTAREAGRLAAAGEALDRAEQAEPDSPWIQAQREILASYAMVDEEWALATRLLIQVDEADPEYYDGRPSAQNNYAWSLFMSDPDDPFLRARGLELARAALEKREEDPVILNTLAWGLLVDGDYHGALATIELAMQRNKGKNLDADIYIYVAALHLVGRTDEAVETYREAVSLHPGGVMHAEVSAVLARAEGGVELTHDEVLETIVGISRARELELQETVTPRKPGLFPEQLASGDAADGAPEALGDPAGPVGEVPADGAEDAAQAPGDDSADEGWRPPRALYESSKKGEKGAAEKTVQ